MSGRTISGAYIAGVSLTNAGDNPVSILSSASIANAGGVAVQAASGIDWTIGNAGRISGDTVGLSLAGSAVWIHGLAVVTNAATGTIAGGSFGMSATSRPRW